MTRPTPLEALAELERIATCVGIAVVSAHSLRAALPVLREVVEEHGEFQGLDAAQIEESAALRATLKTIRAARDELIVKVEGLEGEREHMLAVLLEAYEWFEETIGHDGAPDGGDPGWVGAAIHAIGVEESHYLPDHSEIAWQKIKTLRALRNDLLREGMERDAARAEAGVLREAGQQMSNALYNWKQQQDHILSGRERELMSDMVAKWDAAARPEGRGEGEGS